MILATVVLPDCQCVAELYHMFMIFAVLAVFYRLDALPAAQPTASKH